MKRHEAAYLRVGNTLYRGRNGTLDFSNHRDELEGLLQATTETEIIFFEIVEKDDDNGQPEFKAS